MTAHFSCRDLLYCGASTADRSVELVVSCTWRLSKLGPHSRQRDSRTRGWQEFQAWRRRPSPSIRSSMQQRVRLSTVGRWQTDWLGQRSQEKPSSCSPLSSDLTDKQKRGFLRGAASELYIYIADQAGLRRSGVVLSAPTATRLAPQGATDENFYQPSAIRSVLYQLCGAQ